METMPMTPEETMMDEEYRQAQNAGINLKDIYYVLFRHKWKILTFSIAGVLAAAGVYVLSPPTYQSEAKLLVPYVLEREQQPLNPAAKVSEIKQTETGSFINSELEILSSFDLCTQVADRVGAEKILPGSGGNLVKAAAVIGKNLEVEAIGRSSTIRVVFRHSDPEVVQPVLRNLIERYQKKHVEIRRLAGVIEEDLTRKADELRGKLTKIEEELRGWMDKAGVTSLDAANKAHSDQISKIREELFKAEAELAGRRAGLKELQGTAPKTTENSVGEAVIPPEKGEEYKNVAAELDSLRKTETNLLAQFTGQSQYVKTVREQIAGFEQQKRKLEEDYPQLTKPSALFPAAANQAGPTMNPFMETYRITILQAETNTLHSQLDLVLAEAAEIKKAEAKITELKREKELLETNYRNYQFTLEQAKLDQALGPGKVPNINVVQEPSPPFKNSSKTLKPMMIALAFGVLGGLGLAFCIELVLDRSVRRPIDVTSKLHLPLFLTIPRVGRNGHARLPKAGAESPAQIAHPASSLVGVDPSSFFSHRTNSRSTKKHTALSERSDGDSSPANHHVAGSVAPWNANHKLRAYYEALRDRLITHFEVNNMTHKPKLIAVTSCSQGAGVTSTAAGLAATLSETGDGNVLLVDMNLDQGAAHPFHMGRPACGLLDALESETRDPALVHEKLYLASMNDAANKLPSVLPRRFTHLVPKLKMSDYDYIIFDMPAISQTSITPKLAMYMDMVLMVIESEKTNRDVLEQANSLLAESNVSVKAVLNKYRPYAPRWLHQEL
jgi:uncharacterized protein involved in exopolysaccharide biosynthesis/Mrp family chromosome partitioning ATPase